MAKASVLPALGSANERVGWRALRGFSPALPPLLSKAHAVAPRIGAEALSVAVPQAA